MLPSYAGEFIAFTGWAKQGHNGIVEIFVQPGGKHLPRAFSCRCHLDAEVVDEIAPQITTRLAPLAEPSGGLAHYVAMNKIWYAAAFIVVTGIVFGALVGFDRLIGGAG
ncbi:hypothetical protein [Bradyrhizobium guangdongense]|uniref:Uncharacterized protein n=1 Tax=Bradyrhizobium guangdongense TaxID=1325090 RepID=A0AA87WGQ0_9BRAD|nr:hypothetical protein [Bradyrhizobium guangdongense]GGI34333.1 hypothetical protein GCM10010987_78870 [Bradyrhizobium guangdongense]